MIFFGLSMDPLLLNDCPIYIFSGLRVMDWAFSILMIRCGPKMFWQMAIDLICLPIEKKMRCPWYLGQAPRPPSTRLSVYAKDIIMLGSWLDVANDGEGVDAIWYITIVSPPHSISTARYNQKVSTKTKEAKRNDKKPPEVKDTRLIQTMGRYIFSERYHKDLSTKTLSTW